MLRKLTGLARHVLRLALYFVLGGFLALVSVYIYIQDQRPDLNAWHVAELDEEFTVDSDVSSFKQYLALEDRLFKQLDEQVYQQIAPEQKTEINRFNKGSLSDPNRWPQNWNRSYEKTVDSPQAAVLLLHGLSDSPYSLRKMAERLHAADVYVLGLRIPGHGTAPSGLVEVKWQDMVAAVELAMRHLAEKNDGKPLYIVGYSNGAALAVHYALQTLSDTSLPKVAALAILSPEIGISKVAALAVWQARLGHLLGVEKLAWNSILPEYDPYKYGSFAVNAGDVAYRMTIQIQQRIDDLTASGAIKGIPPILAFSSIVDATVTAPALIKNLFNRLQAGRHELVLFDINHAVGIGPLLKWKPAAMIQAFGEGSQRTYTYTLVTNMNTGNRSVMEQTMKPGDGDFIETPVGLGWSDDVYSLSHVALPFSPDDPLYGGYPTQRSPGIRLGDLAFRGERNVLKVSPSEMLRLRWNPFYPYIEKEIFTFFNL